MGSDLFDVTGKVALVAGAAKGIGFAIARGLGKAGATVVLNGRDASRLGEAVTVLSAEGLHAHTAVFDVRDADGVREQVAAIERDVGPIHILLDDAKFDAWVCGRTPAGRWGEPAELAGAAVFFASPASGFVTGQMLYVDGGVLASL